MDNKSDTGKSRHARFSQRYGYRTVRQALQVECMDDELRNSLWNIITLVYWDALASKGIEFMETLTAVDGITKWLWINHFKWNLDTLENYWPHTLAKLRSHFFEGEWWAVYDFVEALPQSHSGTGARVRNENFAKLINAMLEREAAGYRLVEGRITQVTDKVEIEEIEAALGHKDRHRLATEHLRNALEKLSDRSNPDYRNSVKESISAVESVCATIAGSPASLGKALDKIKGPMKMHPALSGALDKLYGWTSGSDGIRHALMEDPSISFEDAKFMLVSCSAFCNYLIAREAKKK